MFDCTDNQEVGLEAAILERMRNSSLVKWSSAENSTGLKLVTEAAGVQVLGSARGRRASSRPRSGGESQPWRLEE